MNLKTIGIIIRREYLNKVKKKSFLVTTFLVPILVGGGTIALMAIMMTSKDQLKKIAVLDRSEIVLPLLEDSETTRFVDYSDFELDKVKSDMASLGLDAVLSISEINPELKSVTADITSLKPLGIETSENIRHRINEAVEAYRVDSYGIEDLDRIMKEVKSNIKLNSYTIDEEGKETVSETGVYAAISMFLGIIIFIFITVFGASVMSAVIEEKSSRVVEVLVSSVKATELMFGKIFGIALVALTQFFLWIVLSAAIIGIAGGAMSSKLGDLTSNPEEIARTVGVDASQVSAMPVDAGNRDVSVILSTLGNLNLPELICSFILFFIFGYMLYASLYAAIGSAVENEGDTQQLQLPITIPLMIAYIIALYAFKAPDSQIAFWGSMIPFTSPIVMIARLPFGVPFWELALSLGLLIVTFGICAWASAKIYKVGILMFGKKSTWKDLWKWLKQN